MGRKKGIKYDKHVTLKIELPVFKHLQEISPNGNISKTIRKAILSFTATLAQEGEKENAEKGQSST